MRGADYLDFSPDQVILQLTPISFDVSSREIWGALLNGCRLAIYPPRRPTLEELGSVVERFAVTALSMSAALFHQMDEGHLAALKGVRQMMVGGDVLSASQASRAMALLPGVRLINSYGPTENTANTTCHTLRRSPQPGDSVPIGRPISNTSVQLLDAQCRPVPAGVPGELWTGGAGLARGYWRLPAATAPR